MKKSLAADPTAQKQVLVNGDLEQVAEAGFVAWKPWDVGFERDDKVAHSGRFSARCQGADAKAEHGLTNVVVLNQTRPVPIIAECWSKAEGVSADVADSAGDYSLYLDLEYMDGTPLWGQVARFSIGTHDWERKRVLVTPTKPVKNVSVHGIFRHHKGTAWFDDFKLYTLDLPAGAGSFDGVAVTRGASGTQTTSAANAALRLSANGLPPLQIDPATGEVIGADNRRGGFLLRDVAAQSDFRRPIGVAAKGADGVTFEATDDVLNLSLKASYRTAEDHVSIDGTVTDLTGKDRGVSVYFAAPADFVGGQWGEDIRRSVPIKPGQTYANTVGVRAGATGTASRFPLAAVSGPQSGLAMAVPLDQPRMCRLAYDSDSQELYVAFDLGLVKDTAKFPSSASFHIQLFGYEPQWGYRAALARYYALNPEAFRKRVTKEGIWMPFTDIATVPAHQDFGFMFHEGDNNPTFDNANGYLSFVYVEPMSFWMAMAKETPREPAAALAQLKKQAATGPEKPRAQATFNSNITDEAGVGQFSFQDAPWCDGALFLNSPDPAVKGTPEFPQTQFDVLWGVINNSIWGVSDKVAGWSPWESGFVPDPTGGRDGKGAAKCVSVDGVESHGLKQTVVVGQRETAPLIASAWSKALDVSGEVGNDYALYCDLVYTDGTTKWGFVAPFQRGTHDWQRVEVRIVPEKPIQTVAYHLLFRGKLTGTAWFDEAALTDEATGKNLLANPGIEPEAPKPRVVDGNYIDSSEMAATDFNFRREHWRDMALPLTFTREDARPAQLMIFATADFTAEIAKRLHDKGKLMFANSTPWTFPWLGAYLDVMGTETNWAPGGKYTGESDEIMCYRREVCDQKPYLLLQNTDFENWPYEATEKYFKRCAAYAVFPSFFSHNAADNVYFSQPNLYNRDRPLFRKYIPIIKALSAAGWEPVTGATVRTLASVGDSGVYVERYGSAAKGNLHLTVFNATDKPQHVRVELDPAVLGTSATATVTELVSGTGRSLTPQGGRGIWEADLVSEDVAILSVK